MFSNTRHEDSERMAKEYKIGDNIRYDETEGKYIRKRKDELLTTSGSSHNKVLQYNTGG